MMFKVVFTKLFTENKYGKSSTNNRLPELRGKCNKSPQLRVLWKFIGKVYLYGGKRESGGFWRWSLCYP